MLHIFSKMRRQPDAVLYIREDSLPYRSNVSIQLQDDLPSERDRLDGSAACMQSLLRELVELAGQTDSARDIPVLELQLGEVTTITALATGQSPPCLSITALLPRAGRSDYSHLSASGAFHVQGAAGADSEFLWHADDGRVVVVRRVPIAALPDARSALDAILDTADQASNWFASIRLAAAESAESAGSSKPSKPS